MVNINKVLKSLYKRHRRGYSESELEKLKIQRREPRQRSIFMPILYAGAAIRKDAGAFVFAFFTPAPCGSGR